MATKCPKCQFENPADTRFCGNCATPLTSGQDAALSKTMTIQQPPLALSGGRTLAGKYKIIEPIGKGGMGVVYKAEDMKLERMVALKFLPAELTENPEARERFVREAKAAAALSHPHICTIYEIGEEENQYFIAMECIEGKSLKEKIRKGALEQTEALDIAIQVAEGLEEAHKKGIIHRDIKPGNIMVTDKGTAKVMDFGLAKVFGASLITKEAKIMGTVAYMSPEQARGEETDPRTDIWSFGVVLYEMLTGKLPFRGERETSIMYTIVHEEPRPLQKLKPGIPNEISRIVEKTLKKDRNARYSTAEEMARELRRYQETVKVEAAGVFNLRSLVKRLRKPYVAIPTALALTAVAFLAFWFFNRQAKIRWARNKALPEIVRLIQETQNYTAAFRLAVEAERYIPTDSMLLKLWADMSRYVSILTNPPGAEVYTKEYTASDSQWEILGKTPLPLLRIPAGFFHWRIQKSGYKSVETASSGVEFPIADEHGTIPLDFQEAIPSEMVKVKGGRITLDIPGLFHLPAVDLEDYLIDKYEVTNKQFKEFIMAGGYRNSKYWKQGFIKDGRKLSWEEAISEFRDQTGRAGPATWDLGDYPEGRGDYPVTGISWYEAAAYCEFVGKRLPTIYHWNHAAGTTLGTYIIPLSNFTGKELAPVEKFRGLGPYGTYDMAGNVKEWCWNQTENKRYILGGAWNEPEYLFNEADVRSPLERSPACGFRAMKLLSENELPKIATDPISYLSPDFRVSPVSEVEYQIYERLYAYDRTDLKAVVEAVDDKAKDWRKEKVTFKAAYGDERMSAFLFLPKGTTPPYQVVLYFPGSDAIHQLSSESIWMESIDFIIKSGRAVCFPIYKGTYERSTGLKDDNPERTSFYRDHVIMWSKDIGRSIDYIETRSDLDTNRVAYYGTSWGAGLGAIFSALEKRLKVAVLDAGGFWLQPTLPEADQRTFAPRVKIPVLMLNGRYDNFFPLETSQMPMYQAFATPQKDKRHLVLETGHWIERNDRIREVLNWLDRYLGAVE